MPATDLDARIAACLDRLSSAGRRRVLRPAEVAGPGRIRIGGRELVDFSSNDYLGLSRHPLLVERAREWAARYGAGGRASRLVTGHSPALEALEARVAAAKGTQAALVFASGWQCNASVLPALLDRELWDAEPQVLADRLVHASLIAGLRMAEAPFQRFRHNDLGHLARLLERPGPKVVVTESVYSMDGDVADVAELVRLTRQAGAVLYLDEAHATGVLGRDGFGLSPGLGVDVAMGTFSKALGAFGAYVACSAATRDYLVNRASGLIYATALPPAVLGAVDAAIELVPTLDAERRALVARADAVRAAFAEAGLDTGASATQIVPLMVGDERRALAVAAALEERGLLAVAIRPPTVPPGTSRIRFTLSAAHTDGDIERLITAVREVMR